MSLVTTKHVSVVHIVLNVCNRLAEIHYRVSNIPPLRPESSENIPLLLQEADLCFSKQNCPRNPKMGSKQSITGATQ